MLMTVAFAAALTFAPADAGGLALNNVRTTYGMLGPTRPDNKFLPGDSVVLSFDIEGVKPDADGKVLYSIGMEVTDGDGKVLLKQEPSDLESTLALGGNILPAAAKLQVGLDQPPGTYKVKVTVNDRAANASQSLTREYEVLPKTFGLVRPLISGDPDGRVTLAYPAEGQPVWVNFFAVGFERDQATGQPNILVSLRVLDENDNPTRSKPFNGEVNKDVPKNLGAVPMQFVLELNKAGKYMIEIAALDNISKKRASLKLPLTVLKTK